MDADRFDLFVRALTATPSRRGLARWLTGLTVAGGLGALHGPHDAEARRKRRKKKGRKKKCRGNKKKCGKTCIPKASCCGDADCGGGATCQNGSCLCPARQKDCRGNCVPEDDCCPDDIPCGDDCCDVSNDEVCEIDVAGQPIVCQSGGCPETDFCSAPKIHFCSRGCLCTATVDPAPQNACVDGSGLIRPSCQACVTSDDCDPGNVCIATGQFCTECDGPFCTALCPEGAPRAGDRAAASAQEGVIAVKSGRRQQGRR